MRVFLVILAIMLAGCSGAAGSAAPTDEGTSAPTATSSEAPDGSPAPSVEASAANPEPPAASAATALPAACAEGFAKYLVAIEPLVSAFDPASGTLADLFSAEEAARSKAMELLTANDSRAPYSCSEVGLEWAYFDSDTPWDAVLAIAADTAPGTVAYLSGLQATSAFDVNTLSVYGIEGCDDAVASIKESVGAEMGDGLTRVDEMPFGDAIALVGLYRAYMREVQNEVCPRDELGNDEFGFMATAG
jgi:hypothetical protein